MTEAELYRLPPAQRRTLPIDKVLDATLRTHADMTETLELEGFTFVAFDEDEEDTVAGVDRSEFWSRTVNGQVEWFEVWRFEPFSEDDPERAWLRTPSPCDPRLITHD